MKLSQLLAEQLLNEMPYTPMDHDGQPAQLKMDTSDFTHFYSERTLAEEWKLLKEEAKYSVYINNEHTSAICGRMGNRASDNSYGMSVVVTADFKEQMLDHDMSATPLKGALQIDLVVTNRPEEARGGYGTLLYFAMAEAGITIISDNTQYKGGAMLWKNLARSYRDKFVINILENGKVMLDNAGKPVEYDGTNIPDAELWSARPLPRTRPSGLTAAGIEAWNDKQEKLKQIPDKAMTLFVLRKR